MRFRALPKFHDEHRIGVVVADPHLVRQAADLPEGVIALSQVSDQLITLATDRTKCSRVCESHGTTVPTGQWISSLNRQVYAESVTLPRGRRLLHSGIQDHS